MGRRRLLRALEFETKGRKDKTKKLPFPTRRLRKLKRRNAFPGSMDSGEIPEKLNLVHLVNTFLHVSYGLTPG